MQKNDGHTAPQHSHHYMDGSYPPRPAAGICCRSFCYAYFLSCTSILLCLTHISRFAAGLQVMFWCRCLLTATIRVLFYLWHSKQFDFNVCMDFVGNKKT